MGSPAGAPGGPDEKPQHEVCLDDFYLGRAEVTQAQWTAVMGSNPSEYRSCGGDCPVDSVSWEDAQAFIARLNAAGPGPGGPYRLPTEAEWEYAARSGGKDERYPGGSSDLGSIAWYMGNAQAAHPVATRAANGLGLHDMAGSVAEWTWDWYSADAYAGGPRKNPAGPAEGTRRVVRGGSIAEEVFDLRTTYRNQLPPGYRSKFKGFRLASGRPLP